MLRSLPNSNKHSCLSSRINIFGSGMGPLKTAKASEPWVWDQFSISIVLPVLSHGPVCTVIVSLLDILGVVFHICIHWPLIGFRLAIRGLGRIKGPRKAPNNVDTSLRCRCACIVGNLLWVFFSLSPPKFHVSLYVEFHSFIEHDVSTRKLWPCSGIIHV